MRVKKVIKEIKEDLGNNDSRVKKGVYLTDSNEYWWLTYTQSGVVKKLSTALNKAGLA